VKRFRGGLEFKAHRLCVSLNSRLESNKEEEAHRAEDSEAVGRMRHLDFGEGVRPHTPDYKGKITRILRDFPLKHPQEPPYVPADADRVYEP